MDLVEELKSNRGNSTAIIVGLAFMVLFRFIGYAATMAPKVAAIGKTGFCIVVLGDLGHSPRMLLHARSALSAGYRVDMIGYKGSSLPEDIESHPSLHIHYLYELPRIPAGMPKLLYYIYAPFKAVFLAYHLFWTAMFVVSAPEVYVVQNPPVVPTLHVMQFVNWLKQRHLVIDWHNYGSSVVGASIGAKNPLTKLVDLYERFWGYKATVHITVSRAMARDLLYNREVRGKVVNVYDRAPEDFRRLDVGEIHELFTRLRLEDIVKKQSLNSSFLPKIEPTQTLFTDSSAKEGAHYRADRPLLIVSSTSWTADEDFQILLDAAKKYDDQSVEANGSGSSFKVVFPKLLFVITGKGPLKQHYEEVISKMNLQNVVIVTAWLAPEDYPLLLGAADLGVCLHTSTSGVDLPMKVVDMFGCGLPVCAFKYPTISELVVAKTNGLLFSDSQELSAQFVTLFKEFPLAQPAQQKQLTGMRNSIRTGFQTMRWEENWLRTLYPLLRNLDKTWADTQLNSERPLYSLANNYEGPVTGTQYDDIEDDEEEEDEE